MDNMEEKDETTTEETPVDGAATPATEMPVVEGDTAATPADEATPAV